MKLAFRWRWMFFREYWPLATYCHAIFLFVLIVYFIVLKLELQFSRRCFASTGNAFTHSFLLLLLLFLFHEWFWRLSLTDYFSLPPTPTPQLPLHCNPVISGVATTKTNARKTQCSIFSVFRLFYKNTFPSMTWPEKGKKIRIFVWCLTDDAVDHLAIRGRLLEAWLALTVG